MKEPREKIQKTSKFMLKSGLNRLVFFRHFEFLEKHFIPFFYCIFIQRIKKKSKKKL
jgi:hypothetical protein